jgi:hypothetical protein
MFLSISQDNHNITMSSYATIASHSDEVSSETYTERVVLAKGLSVQQQLKMLRFYLRRLPTSMDNPIISVYNFSSFSLPNDLVEEIGEIQAIDKELEARLGVRKHGLKLRERGFEIEVLVDLLEEWTNKTSGDVMLEVPGNLHGEILIQKWISDILRAAQNAFEDAEIEVSGHIVV